AFRDRYNLSTLIKKVVKPKHDPAKDREDQAKWDVVPTKIEMNEILSIDVTQQDKKGYTGNGGDN
ncbi:MAG: hypothetical protein IKV58_00420, partial [Oscillospiraceae bacterium]|nr:hypothetical protein [Oscillospiraceae bacterium]